MKRLLKEILCIVLSLVMCLSAAPINVLASVSENSISKSSKSVIEEEFGIPWTVNPIYEGMLSASVLEEMAKEAITEEDTEDIVYETEEDTNSDTSFDGAVKFLREGLVNRETSITLTLVDTEGVYNRNTLFSELYDEATKHDSQTLKPTEGDYLLSHILGYGFSGTATMRNGATHYTFMVSVNYSSTAQQEVLVTQKVNEVMSSLNLDSKTDLEKIRAIYDFIADSVEYDHPAADGGDAMVKAHPEAWSAYGAIVLRKCVCQGYAGLFYRMMLEAGINCRYISGQGINLQTGRGEGHAWNIVEYEGAYYNMDTTWDADEDNVINNGEDHDYYMKNSDDFDMLHYRKEQYKTEQFMKDHIMALTSMRLSQMAPQANITKSLTKTTGGTISTAASGKPKLLILGSCSCLNTQNMLSRVSSLGDTIINGMDIVFGEVNSFGVQDINSLLSKFNLNGKAIGCTNGNSIFWDYSSKYENGSTFIPFVALIDKNNKIVYHGIGGGQTEVISYIYDAFGGNPKYVPKITRSYIDSTGAAHIEWESIPGIYRYGFEQKKPDGSGGYTGETVDNYITIPCDAGIGTYKFAIYSKAGSTKSMNSEVSLSSLGPQSKDSPVYFDADTNTFTFNNCDVDDTACPLSVNGEGYICSDRDLNIVLKGNNKIKAGSKFSNFISGKGKVTIEGDGSLRVETDGKGIISEGLIIKSGRVEIISKDECLDPSYLDVYGGTIVLTSDVAAINSNAGLNIGNASVRVGNSEADAVAGTEADIATKKYVKIYKKVEYAAKFYIGSELKSTSYYEPSDKIIEPVIEQRKGYSIDGWYKTNELKSEDKWNFDTDTITGETVLYARWIPFVGKITFNYNGGTGVERERSVNYGEKIGTLPAATKDELQFLGWFTSETGGNPLTGEEIFEYDTDITLYARFKEPKRVGKITASYLNYENGISKFVELKDNDEVFEGTKIYLSCETNSADLYYVIDKAFPSDLETCRYEEPIALTKNCTLYVLGKCEEYKDEKLTISLKVKPVEVNRGEISEEDVIKDKNDPQKIVIPENVWVAGIPQKVQYTGKAITFPDMRVYYQNMLLVKGKDYTVKYDNNKNAGEAGVVVVLKGNITGTLRKTFEIEPCDISLAEAETIVLAESDVSQYGLPVVKYMLGGKQVKLKKDVDYTLGYPSNSNNAYTAAGTYDIEITGIGNYKTYSKDLIVKEIITSSQLVNKLSYKISNAEFGQSSDNEPLSIIVKNKGEEVTLEKADNAEKAKTIVTDKDLIYYLSNNDSAGTGYITFIGNENNGFGGEVRKTYKITGRNIKLTEIEGVDAEYPYNGKEYKPHENSNFSITYNDKKGTISPLGKDDYEISYLNNTNAGKATIIVTGKKGYSGTIKKTFKITPSKEIRIDKVDGKSLSSGTPVVTYTKKGPKPTVSVVDADSKTLILNKDYTVSYSKNTKAYTADGTKNSPTIKIKGKGNYAGTIEEYFTIEKSSLKNVASILVTDAQYKNKPFVKGYKTEIYDSNGIKLSQNTDYIVKDLVYANPENVENKTLGSQARNAGDSVDINDYVVADTNLYAIIVGKGLYEDPETEIKVPFRVIEPARDIAKATVVVSEEKEYTGKNIELMKNDLSVSFKDDTLTSSDFDIIGYTSNIYKGTAKITIKGKGKYGGIKTVTFKIKSKLYIDN